MGNTEIKQCSCVSQYQDDRYGKSNRVHNVGGSKGKEKLRCTVCGKEK